MASLTEVLGANNAPPTQGIDISGNVSSGLKAGIQLATAAEQVDAQKTQLEEQKLQLNQNKFKAIDGILKSLNRMNPSVAKIAAPKMKQQLQGYGADPAIIDTMLADPEFGRSYASLSSLLTGEALNDPKKLGSALQQMEDAGLLHEGITSAMEARKSMFERDRAAQQNTQYYAGLKNQKDIATMNNETKLAKNSTATNQLTVGDKARDTKFAKEYSGFFDAGGAAGVEANLSSLDESLKTLEQGKTTQLEGFVPDIVGNAVFPQTANVRTNITGVLIQGLKDTFGGQLSDGERKAMVESAYVASADPKDNAKRVKALADKIKAGARAKELAGQYFETNGTLKGFKGTKSFDIGGKTVNFNQGEAAPTANQRSQVSADIEAKKQKAIQAGYSPAEVEAYVQKLMNVGK